MANTSTEVQRVSPYAVDGGCDAYGQMEDDAYGEYVHFTDYAALSAERDALRGALRTEKHADAKAIATLRDINAENDRLRAALKISEAALSDIGDAHREEGDDLAWCERRAAKAIPIARAALKGENTDE